MQNRQRRNALNRQTLGRLFRIFVASALLIFGSLGIVLNLYRVASAIFVLAALFIFIAHYLNVRNSTIDPSLRQLEALEEVAKGNFDVDLSGGENASELVQASGEALEGLVANVRGIVNQVIDTTELQESILAGLDEGVIATDRRGRLRLETKLVPDLLARSSSSDIEHIFLRNVNYNHLWSIMAYAMDRNEKIEEEIRVSTDSGIKIIEVYAASLMLGNDTEGALAVLRDVTKLRQLENVRRDFVANVSHELKTPLTSIRGYIDLLDSPNRTREQVQQFTQIISIEADRLQSLIEDLLDLSEIEAGDKQRAVSVERTYFYQVADESLEELGHQIMQKNITVHLEVDPDLSIEANKTRIQQLLGNLISNAVKYNNDGGEIWIRSQVEKNRLMISVEDSGLGIPVEDQERIFERFYRVNKSRSQDIEGTGLGLSIVKHIANLYGGQIVVESTPGEGTKFTVVFPRQPH